MTIPNRPAVRDVLARAWEIRPSMFGFLGVVVAALFVCSLLDIPATAAVTALVLFGAGMVALTVVVAAAQLRKEADDGRR